MKYLEKHNVLFFDGFSENSFKNNFLCWKKKMIYFYSLLGIFLVVVPLLPGNTIAGYENVFLFSCLFLMGLGFYLSSQILNNNTSLLRDICKKQKIFFVS